MRVQVAKWENSLAVRIPVDCARKIGMKAGDALHLAVAQELGIKRVATLDANQRGYAERLGLGLEVF